MVAPNYEVYKSSSLQEEFESSHQEKNDKAEDGSWRLTFSFLSFFSSCLFSLVNLVILLDDEGCKPPSSTRRNRVNTPRQGWQGRLKFLED